MIKGHFLKTTSLLFLLWIFTYNILPTLIDFGCEKIMLYNLLVKPVEAFCNNLPLAEVQNTVQTILSAINNQTKFVLNAQSLAKDILSCLIVFIVIGYTLPLRSICCTLLYKDLETKKLKEKKIKEL